MARVYIDSCLMIYAVEKSPAHGASARRMLLQGMHSHDLCISGLVRLECRVAPLRRGYTELLSRFDLAFGWLEILPMGMDAFDLAAELRARHGLKTPDALHVACAIANGCDEFWTNDDRLAKLSDRIKTRKID